MDGWIVTVDTFRFRGPDTSSPPLNQVRHRAAHMRAPDPTNVQRKHGFIGNKQPGVYKPRLLKQLAG